MWSFRRSKRETKILHPVADRLYGYTLGQRFDPGAQAEIFDPLFSNPLYVFRGPARLAGFLQVFQPPQIFVNFAGSVHGIAGTIAGQIVQQPLVVPPTDNTGS